MDTNSLKVLKMLVEDVVEILTCSITIAVVVMDVAGTIASTTHLKIVCLQFQMHNGSSIETRKYTKQSRTSDTEVHFFKYITFFVCTYFLFQIVGCKGCKSQDTYWPLDCPNLPVPASILKVKVWYDDGFLRSNGIKNHDGAKAYIYATMAIVQNHMCSYDC